MKKFRKCLSLLLSFLLIAGMLPATALAVEGWDGSAALEAPAGSGSEADPYRLGDEMCIRDRHKNIRERAMLPFSSNPDAYKQIREAVQ